MYSSVCHMFVYNCNLNYFVFGGLLSSPEPNAHGKLIVYQ